MQELVTVDSNTGVCVFFIRKKLENWQTVKRKPYVFILFRRKLFFLCIKIRKKPTGWKEIHEAAN